MQICASDIPPNQRSSRISRVLEIRVSSDDADDDKLAIFVDCRCRSSRAALPSRVRSNENVRVVRQLSPVLGIRTSFGVEFRGREEGDRRRTAVRPSSIDVELRGLILSLLGRVSRPAARKHGLAQINSAALADTRDVG
jgi:hypothetical protein